MSDLTSRPIPEAPVDYADVIQRWPVWDPRTILRLLADYATKFNSDSEEPVKVTLSLRSGQTLSGTVIRNAHQDKEEFIVLKQKGEHGEPSALAFLRFDEVAALQVFTLPYALNVLLTESQLAKEPAPAATRLDIKRSLQQINEGLQKIGQKFVLDCNWTTVGETPQENAGVGQMGSRIQKVVDSIASTAMGKTALESVKTIQLNGAQGPFRVERAADLVKIQYDFRRPVSQITEETLRQQLEAVL